MRRLVGALVGVAILLGFGAAVSADEVVGSVARGENFAAATGGEGDCLPSAPLGQIGWFS